jgi:hypothetical protein
MLSPLILKKKRARISKGGNSPIIYLPTKYFSPDDEVDLELMLRDDKIELILTKRLYKFTIDDIKEIVGKDFVIEYDKIVAGVQVFNAISGNVSLSYTQSIDENTKPARITVSRLFDNVESREDYLLVFNLADELEKKGFDVYVEPIGDLDSLSIYREPKRYEFNNEFDAIQALRKTGKELGFSVVVRFDNEKNSIHEVKSALGELQLRHRVSP